MKEKIHPQMIALLENLFPDRTGEEAFEQICKHGKQSIIDIEYMTKKKDADTIPAPSIQQNLI